jgi:hypothetical protein
MTYRCTGPRIACSLNRALLALGRDNGLRRNYLRRRWQGSDTACCTHHTARAKILRQLKFAIEYSAIHLKET